MGPARGRSSRISHDRRLHADPTRESRAGTGSRTSRARRTDRVTGLRLARGRQRTWTIAGVPVERRGRRDTRYGIAAAGPKRSVTAAQSGTGKSAGGGRVLRSVVRTAPGTDG